ncbi:hypothetical protein DAPPUDRAFT_115993 [Daphnia pulex]|uniref:Uncharacterized protein n=1 Tax=Daphnia pulex TaxID=6669 RepID=E9HN75_DAPPU|nr:hypothetical protein DAPPUDRAFT_115993 [Daphnia pulex]|eukprot:EFX66808.1 hypothetical protein DAPPUDRAFT_115993 [Daphnia pulex]
MTQSLMTQQPASPPDVYSIAVMTKSSSKDASLPHGREQKGCWRNPDRIIGQSPKSYGESWSHCTAGRKKNQECDQVGSSVSSKTVLAKCEGEVRQVKSEWETSGRKDAKCGGVISYLELWIGGRITKKTLPHQMDLVTNE